MGKEVPWTFRKPVAILESYPNGRDSHPSISALCDDGSYWEWVGPKWIELAPIPGTKRDYNVEGK